MDACIRIFLYTPTSQYQNQSRRLSFLCNAHALLTNPLRCPDTCERSYTIRIRYVWTQIFLYPHKKICGYKNLRIRVDGASEKRLHPRVQFIIALLTSLPKKKKTTKTYKFVVYSAMLSFGQAVHKGST